MLMPSRDHHHTFLSVDNTGVVHVLERTTRDGIVCIRRMRNEEWIIVAGMDGIVQEAYGTFISLGYHSADLIGQKVEFIAAQPDREEHDAYMAKFSTLQPHADPRRISVNVRRKDGTVIAALKQLHHDEAARLFIATFLSVEGLHASFQLDQGGQNLIWINDGFTLITGWGKEQIPLPANQVFDLSEFQQGALDLQVVQVFRKPGSGNTRCGFTCYVKNFFREDGVIAWKLCSPAPLAISEAKFPQTLDGFVILDKLIGCGISATVYQGRLISSGQLVAVKSMDKRLLYFRGTTIDIDNEIHIHRLACAAACPSVVSLLQVLEQRDVCHLVMEFMSGTVKQLVFTLDMLSVRPVPNCLSPRSP